MSLTKSAFHTFANLLPYSWLSRVSPVRLLLPYHHVVSDDYLPHIKGLYSYKNVSQFTKDLDWLLKNRRPADPENIARKLAEGKPLDKNTFLLTFDDGFRELYDIIAPILKKKGIPAIFFINPSFIDNKNLFYRCKLSLIIEKILRPENKHLVREIARVLETSPDSLSKIRQVILKIHYPQQHLADELGNIANISFDDFLKSQQPFLSTSQVEMLAKNGFTIGGHSMDHPYYSLIELKDQIKQTKDSLSYVHRITGDKYAYFSFPHNDTFIKQEFFNTFQMETPGNTTFFGVQNQKDELRNNMVHRYNAENPAFTIKKVTKSVLLYNFLLGMAGKREIVRN